MKKTWVKPGFGRLAEYRQSIGTRDAAVPCCGMTVPLDTPPV
jgi:hypothetical protein